MSTRLSAAIVIVTLLGGCNVDGSANWNAIGAGLLGVGAAALGAASIYETSHTYYYQPVIVCRPWWAC